MYILCIHTEDIQRQTAFYVDMYSHHIKPPSPPPLVLVPHGFSFTSLPFPQALPPSHRTSIINIRHSLKKNDGEKGRRQKGNDDIKEA